jgi:hypothetical protein
MIAEYKTVFDLLSDERRWTVNHYALNELGYPVSPLSPDACRFCLRGAISRVYGRSGFENAAQCNLYPVIGDKSISVFNDTSTHAEVLAAVKAAGI